MNKLISGGILWAVILAAGCGSHPTDPQLEQAFQFHQQAIDVNKAIQEQLQSADQYDPKTNALRQRLAVWEENLVEVPGFEHEHDHGGAHHHHHHHNSGPEVTPEHMLNIQKEFLDSIRAIQEDLQLILN